MSTSAAASNPVHAAGEWDSDEEGMEVEAPPKQDKFKNARKQHYNMKAASACSPLHYCRC